MKIFCLIEITLVSVVLQQFCNGLPCWNNLIMSICHIEGTVNVGALTEQHSIDGTLKTCNQPIVVFGLQKSNEFHLYKTICNYPD